jgi:hypothetical protein
MKTFLVFSAMLVISTLPLAAQRGGAHVGGSSGNLALHGMTHPLGGFAPGFGPGQHLNTGFNNVNPGFNNGRFGTSLNRNFNNFGRRGVQGYPYAYSVWVPDYFDYLDQAGQYYGSPYGVPAAPSAPQEPSAPGQPVIINQYFNTPPPGAAPPSAPAPQASNRDTAAPGAPLSDPQNYYLIAYKDHAVYPALAYWIEDKTLHYVTTQNTHNQASIDLIDVPLTTKLNQDHNVTFTIPGQ